jgi:hypothetical protein
VIISIDVVSTNELFSKYFCEALAKKVSDFISKQKISRKHVGFRATNRFHRRELNGAITVAVANDNTLNPAMNVRRAPSARRQVDANTAILTEFVNNRNWLKVLRKETPHSSYRQPILLCLKNGFGKVKDCD